MAVSKRTHSKKSPVAKAWADVTHWMQKSKSIEKKTAITAGGIVLGVIAIVAAAMIAGPRDGGRTTVADAQSQHTTAPQTFDKPADMPAIAAGSADGKTEKRPAVVTITGCLERNDERFRLKDTAGEDAPKARSWKSGFLKKSSATINVVDASNRLRLPEHVGQRVAVRGLLVDRDIQVRSLQPVAPSCSKSKA